MTHHPDPHADTRPRGPTCGTCHPLSSFVLGLFASPGAAHDVTTVRCAMAGCTMFRGQAGGKAHTAYRVVAADVLGCLVGEGALVIDAQGWYRLPTAEQAREPVRWIPPRDRASTTDDPEGP